MTEKICVALVGISEREQGIFGQVARFSSSRERSYELCADSAGSPVDLVVANDNESALDQARALMVDRPAVGLVVVSDNAALHSSAHLLRRPLLISRVLRVLDQASAELPGIPQEAAGETGPAREERREPAETAADQPEKSQKAEKAGESQQQESSTGEVAEAPVVEQLPPAPEVAPVAAVAEQRQALSVRALVVGDSLPIRKQLELELGEAGIVADFAETGEQALELAADTDYDLVFLDIMIPGIDGYEVCKTLRQAPENKKTPIIMLSEKTSPLDEVQGVLAGASTYLTKPVSHEEIQDVIRRVVKWLNDFRPRG